MRFRAPAWAWLLVVAATCLFAGLGTWQLQRGKAKQERVQALQDRSAEAQALSASSEPPPGLGLQRARAVGTYIPGRQLLEDGQSHQGQPGYHVWTPLQLQDGAVALVNRGWIPQHAAGLSPPAGVVTVTGFWRALPKPGLRLAAANACTPDRKFPAVVLYPTAEEVACLLGRPALAGLLLLDADVPGGYVREWTDAGFPPERHFGYAFQWYALALATLAVFFVVNRKR